jgi:hypothetical protein
MPVGETLLRRVLFLPRIPRMAEERHVRPLLTFSIAISAARCLTTYVLVPVLSPVLEPTLGNSPAIAMPLSALALAFDVQLVRRLWLTNYRFRWKLTAAYAVLIAGILGLLVKDIARLAS